MGDMTDRKNLLETDPRLAGYFPAASKAIRRYAMDQVNKPAGKRLTKDEVLFLTAFACLRVAAFFIATLGEMDGTPDAELHDLFDAELRKARESIGERGIGAPRQ